MQLKIGKNLLLLILPEDPYICFITEASLLIFYPGQAVTLVNYSMHAQVDQVFTKLNCFFFLQFDKLSYFFQKLEDTNICKNAEITVRHTLTAVRYNIHFFSLKFDSRRNFLVSMELKIRKYQYSCQKCFSSYNIHFFSLKFDSRQKPFSKHQIQN